MYLPIFIAILMGLISPTSHTSNCSSGGTVYVSNNGSEGDPEEDPDTGEDDGTGVSGPGPAGPGGGSGQNPPPKP